MLKLLVSFTMHMLKKGAQIENYQTYRISNFIVFATTWIPVSYGEEILQDKGLLRDIGAVCYGEVLQKAAVYEKESGLHPTLLFNGFGAHHRWADRLPIGWLPLNLGSLELVACVDESPPQSPTNL